MKINIVSVGNRMPKWVQQGYDEYAKRMPDLVLKEVVPGKRGKNSDISRIIRDEGQRMLQVIPTKAHVVILDISGKSWTTHELS